MKTTVCIVLTIASLGLSARGADNVTSNYFSGAVTVLATATDMGDTGLGQGTNYLAFPLTSLSGVTTGNTADVRAVMYGIEEAYYVAWTNITVTNRSPSTIARASTIETVGTNNYKYIQHVLKTVKLLGEETLP